MQAKNAEYKYYITEDCHQNVYIVFFGHDLSFKGFKEEDFILERNSRTSIKGPSINYPVRCHLFIKPPPSVGAFVNNHQNYTCVRFVCFVTTVE